MKCKIYKDIECPHSNYEDILFCSKNRLCEYVKFKRECRKMNKSIKETKEDYYYTFPKDRYYIIRWLADGGVHLYPKADLELPEGFNTKEEAEEYIKEWYRSGEAKVVNGLEASKYPVPKRW